MTQKNQPSKAQECPEKNSEKIDQYLAGKLSPEEMDAFEQHFFQCDACFKELQFRRDVAGTVKESAAQLKAAAQTPNAKEKAVAATAAPGPGKQQDPAASKSSETNSSGNWRYAVAAIIALLLLAYYTVPFFQQSGADIDEKIVDATPPGRNVFAPSPYLEARISESFRSSEEINILTPPNDVQYLDSMQFRWEFKEAAADSPDSLAFYILNNMEEKVFFRQVRGQNFTLIEKLNPGLYYWLLETDVETIHMGKFHVGEPR